MKEIKFKYYKDLLQLGLFQIVLLFSVFVFSGFNVQIQSAFLESVKTELVDSRVYKPAYSLEKSTKIYGSTGFCELPLAITPYSSYALLNLNHLIVTKLKSYRSRFAKIINKKIKFVNSLYENRKSR